MFTIYSAPFYRVCRQRNYPRSKCPFILDERERLNKLRESNYKSYVARNECNTDRRRHGKKRFNRKGHRGGSSKGTKASVNEQEGNNANPAARNESKKLGAEAVSGAFTDTKSDKRPSMTSLVLLHGALKPAD